MPNNNYTFEISLSVLNHLGRNLYRSFTTILGEAISNAWDADAENVWIFIDKNNNNLIIKDDGVGMNKDDFQNKFLKIGYSKRKLGDVKSPKGRPYIGAKGIGKLALLSCAEKIHIMSKVKGGEYVGGVINNAGLDKAIKDDIKPDQYPLEDFSDKIFGDYKDNHTRGTIIYFESLKGGIKNSLELLKKIIALYFRFSLLDNNFNIMIEGEKITCKHLDDLAQKTEFLWNINNFNDPFIKDQLKALKENKSLIVDGNIGGFIASVNHYRDLGIMNLGERVGIDLFVNGRLREKNILKHISKSRLPEEYLYGQIHFNGLDSKNGDPFTTNREGVIETDINYQLFLKKIGDDVINIVINDWDKWRRKHREDGDAENKDISEKDRKAEEFFNIVSKDFELPKGAKNKKRVDIWVNELRDDARYNFGSYADCFISENLIRKYVIEEEIKPTPEVTEEIGIRRGSEKTAKNKGNISIEIRKENNGLSYLSMDFLANLVDKRDAIKEACLARDANEYKPMRDALAHTSLLTDQAKTKLTTVYENIKARIKNLLS